MITTPLDLDEGHYDLRVDIDVDASRGTTTYFIEVYDPDEDRVEARKPIPAEALADFALNDRPIRP